MPTVDRVRPPAHLGPTPLITLSFGTEQQQIKIPTVDEDWTVTTSKRLKRKVLLTLLRNPVLFPICDYDARWESAEVARDTFQEVLPLGSYMARPYHYWKEMSSDAAMSRLAFAGLGALRLMPYEASAATRARRRGVGARPRLLSGTRCAGASSATARGRSSTASSTPSPSAARASGSGRARDSPGSTRSGPGAARSWSAPR
ncbi:MAG: hypothetical protein IPN17_35100 [Deltaproteobacteria bacterium]|nr:hypothetical protein [Deltaproteobacteria bacterium]